MRSIVPEQGRENATRKDVQQRTTVKSNSTPSFPRLRNIILSTIHFILCEWMKVEVVIIDFLSLMSPHRCNCLKFLSLSQCGLKINPGISISLIDTPGEEAMQIYRAETKQSPSSRALGTPPSFINQTDQNCCLHC
jgi:hypothetical protein